MLALWQLGAYYEVWTPLVFFCTSLYQCEQWVLISEWGQWLRGTFCVYPSPIQSKSIHGMDPDGLSILLDGLSRSYLFLWFFCSFSFVNTSMVFLLCFGLLLSFSNPMIFLKNRPLLRAFPPAYTNRIKTKNLAINPPKSIGISLSKLYKISGFSTVARSFGWATVHQQTKLIQFYIILSLSLSLSLSQLRASS